MALTKNEIYKEVKDRLRYPQKQSIEVVETLLEIMKRTMETGESILISGFGKFKVAEKNERRGRNPATGGSMMLAPRRVVTFQCSKSLREKVNKK